MITLGTKFIQLLLSISQTVSFDFLFNVYTSLDIPLPEISNALSSDVDKFLADWTFLLLCIKSYFSSIRVKRWFSIS